MTHTALIPAADLETRLFLTELYGGAVEDMVRDVFGLHVGRSVLGVERDDAGVSVVYSGPAIPDFEGRFVF